MDTPKIIARVVQAHEDAEHDYRSYEEANWARLSPHFRAAHNRLRQLRHLPPIPDPAIDLYVPPDGPALQPFDPTNADFQRAVREHYTPIANPYGREGFAIKGGFHDMSEDELRAINRDPR